MPSNPIELTRLFIRTLRAHHRRMHTVNQSLGIHPGQAPLFFILSSHEGLNQKELAEQMHIKPATLTVMLTRLEQAGFIERFADPADQRVWRIRLTPQGRSISMQVHEAAQEIDNLTFGNFTEEERSQFRGLMDKMYENLKNEPRT
ncbi:MarR family winged helix-turn-helix transcriptional regulator [Saccharibacillus kuerlensis]|uniref:MarR family transcriptional regulator n=1 Tax=Saccharibacillus kuerlensis TaxID=459527 RepID=A0ABQ2KUY6_9BACL|nr:MarR family transcriptional regulator [Saccharibacillus kuerlensis]GGN93551.1 MarR family transcriptional regulator [Saccharibacillus kuerlensis]